MKGNIFGKVGLASLGLILASTSVTYAEDAEVESIKRTDLKSVQSMSVDDENDAREVIKALQAQLKTDKSGSEDVTYAYKRVREDKQGIKHYVFQTKVRGVDIEDGEVKVHVDTEQHPQFINGPVLDEKVDLDNKQRISKEDAEKSVYEALDLKPSEVKNHKGFDVVYKNELKYSKTHEKMIYAVNMNYVTPKTGNWLFEVDAETGKVLRKIDKMKRLSHEGHGVGVNGDEKSPLMLDKVDEHVYTLFDTSREAEIETYDAHNTKDLATASLMTHDSDHFDEESQGAGVDAHFYAGQVFDFYKENFGRNSFDNHGAPIKSYVHFSQNYNNANWNGQYMIYGDGDGHLFNPLSGANDIVAHELTHAVTEKTANLAYENQPGALNESFSDVFGYFVDPDDYLMGEDVYTPGKPGDALRSLEEPEKYDQPAHMNDYRDLPNTEKGDYGGVHVNSGIPNKAFYNTVTTIGIEKSKGIYYKALTEYLTPNSQFVDAKRALIQSALDMHDEETARAVEEAWIAVGVEG